MTIKEWAAYAEKNGFADKEVSRIALECDGAEIAIPTPEGYHFDGAKESVPKLKETSNRRIKIKDKVRVAGTDIYGTVVAMRHEDFPLNGEYIIAIEHVAEIDGRKYLVREELVETDLIHLAVIGGEA